MIAVCYLGNRFFPGGTDGGFEESSSKKKEYEEMKQSILNVRPDISKWLVMPIIISVNKNI